MRDTFTADKPCPPWRRLTALAYDLVAVLAIVMVVGLLCELATGGQLINASAGQLVQIPWWYPLLQGLVVAAYFIASWRRGGQTLGMRPWHIRLISRSGAPVSMRQAIIRVIAAALPLLLLELAPFTGLRASVWMVIGAWIVWFGNGLFDPRRRALHDLVAGTEIRQFA